MHASFIRCAREKMLRGGFRFPLSRYAQKVSLRYSSPETNTRE